MNGRASAETDTASKPKGRRSRQQFAARLEATRALVGYTEEDEARVQATREAVLTQAEAIANTVYERLLSRPETAAQFTHDGVRPDRAYVAFQEWLRLAVEAPLDERLAAHLAGIGRTHTARGGDPGVRVKGRYLVAAMSVVQTVLAGLLAEAGGDPRDVAAAIAAWNKLLMVHLDMFLAVYGAAEGNPHWY
jgi:hypothetical protein